MTNSDDERTPTQEDVEREARRLERLRRLRLVTGDREPDKRTMLITDLDPDPKEAA